VETKSMGSFMALQLAMKPAMSRVCMVAGPPTFRNGETAFSATALALYSDMYGSGNGTPHISLSPTRRAPHNV
jgi:hypothetical protein